MALSELAHGRANTFLRSEAAPALERVRDDEQPRHIKSERIRAAMRFLRESANTQQEDYESWVRSLGLEIEASESTDELNPTAKTQTLSHFEKVPNNDINSFTNSLLEAELDELKEIKTTEKSDERIIVSFPAVNTSQLAPQH